MIWKLMLSSMVVLGGIVMAACGGGGGACEPACPTTHVCEGGTCVPRAGDTTPPALVSRAPAATDIGVHSTLSFTFDEALALASMASVVVRDEASSSAVTATRELSADGLTLTVSPTVTAPMSILVDLTGLTDAAGNHVTQAAIRYHYPGWLPEPDPLGGAAAQGGTAAFGFDGARPVVGFKLGDRTHVARLESGAWARPGVPVDGLNSAGRTLSPMALAARGDQIVLSWGEPTGTSTQATLVKRWNGSAWEFLGTNLVDRSIPPLSIAIDSTGVPIIAYESSAWLHVSRWSGSAWTELGTWDNLTRQAPRLALASDDSPVVSVAQTNLDLTKDVRAFQWSSTTWSQLGSPLPSIGTYRSPVVVDGSALWLVRGAASGRIEANPLSGAAWGTAEVVNAPEGGFRSPMAAARVAGEGVHVLWTDGGGVLRVARRDAAGWARLPELTSGAAGVTEVLGIGGASGVGLWIAWVDNNSMLRVYRANR